PERKRCLDARINLCHFGFIGKISHLDQAHLRLTSVGKSLRLTVMNIRYGAACPRLQQGAHDGCSKSTGAARDDCMFSRKIHYLILPDDAVRKRTSPQKIEPLNPAHVLRASATPETRSSSLPR